MGQWLSAFNRFGSSTGGGIALEVTSRIRGELESTGEAEDKKQRRVTVSVRLSEQEFLGLPLETREPPKKRKKEDMPKAKTVDILHEASFDKASDLDFLFGKDWNIAFDGRVSIVACPSIKFRFVRTTLVDRKEGLDYSSETGYCPVEYDLNVSFNTTRVLWDREGAFQVINGFANNTYEEVEREVLAAVLQRRMHGLFCF